MKGPIRIPIPGISLVCNAGGAIGANPAGNFAANGNEQWTVTSSDSTSALLSFETFSDLSGLRYGDQTLFPIGYAIQTWQNPECLAYTGPNYTKASTIKMVWITSTETITTSITDDELLTGFLYSGDDDHDFTELVGYGWQTWNTDTSIGTAATVPLQKDAFGSLQPTATSRFSTRVIVSILNGYATSDNTSTWEIYPSQITIPQTVEKEANLQYIMRLQRLANRSDV